MGLEEALRIQGGVWLEETRMGVSGDGWVWRRLGAHLGQSHPLGPL